MDAQFYKGRANSSLLTLYSDGVLVPAANITKIEFSFAGLSFNSVDNPELFEMGAETIRLKFGAMDAPAGLHSMKLTVYSSDHPEGVVWGSALLIKLEPA